MYSLFLFLSLLSFVLLLRALDRGTWRSWTLWGARHPARRRLAPVRRARARRAGRVRARRAPRPAAAGGDRLRGASPSSGIPFWLTDLVLAGRFDVGVGGRGAKLGGPWAIVTYLWQTAGDFSTGRWPVLVVVLAARADRARDGAHRDPRARPLRDRRPRGGLPRSAPRRLDLAGVAPPHLRAALLRDPRRRGDPPQRRDGCRRPRSC